MQYINTKLLPLSEKTIPDWWINYDGISVNPDIALAIEPKLKRCMLYSGRTMSLRSGTVPPYFNELDGWYINPRQIRTCEIINVGWTRTTFDEYRYRIVINDSDLRLHIIRDGEKLEEEILNELLSL